MPARRAESGYAVALAALLASGVAHGMSQYEYFQNVDRDGDGAVSLAEYHDWMSRAFHDMDRNGDGVLDAHEQRVPTAKPVTLAAFHARLATQFEKQDGNRDGVLSPKEYLAPPR